MKYILLILTAGKWAKRATVSRLKSFYSLPRKFKLLEALTKIFYLKQYFEKSLAMLLPNTRTEKLCCFHPKQQSDSPGSKASLHHSLHCQKANFNTASES
ncbi:UNVERIFIED_CONTAM: hypothetical protein K2H54_007107 [Gekko kuhli]